MFVKENYIGLQMQLGKIFSCHENKVPKKSIKIEGMWGGGEGQGKTGVKNKWSASGNW